MAFSTSSSRMRRAAVRLRLAIAGPGGASTMTRSCIVATSRATWVTSAHSVSPASTAASKRCTRRARLCARSTRLSRICPRSSGGAVPFDSVWAMPRTTVTGVRSSWPSREISSWRRADRSSKASCAISSWRVRRRSRSRASVSSSMTVGVTSGEMTPPPTKAWRIACRISSPSESFST